MEHLQPRSAVRGQDPKGALGVGSGTGHVQLHPIAGRQHDRFGHPRIEEHRPGDGFGLLGV